jgi:hypothetical protein
MEIYGQTLIAEAMGISRKTIATWMRCQSGKLSYNQKTAREETRVIGICLINAFPNNLDQIAKVMKYPIRSIQQWRLDTRPPKPKTDLFRRTKRGVELLQPYIHKYYQIDDFNKVKLNTKFPPSLLPLYYEIWLEYDKKLDLLLSSVADYRFIKAVKTIPIDFGNIFEGFELNRHKRVLIGPSASRYKTHYAGFGYEPDDDYLMRRKVGHLSKGGLANQYLNPPYLSEKIKTMFDGKILYEMEWT